MRGLGSTLAARCALAVAAAAVLVHCTLAVDLDELSTGGPAADAGRDVVDANDPADPDARPDSVDAATSPDAEASVVHLVQQVTMLYTNGPSQVAQLTTPVTAGNFVLGVMLTHNPDAGAAFSIADSLSNTWLRTPYRRCPASQIGSQIWYVENAKPGVETVTVSQAPSTGQLALSLFEYAGIARSAALDVERNQCAPLQTTDMSTPTATTTAQDLVVGVFADPCGTGTMTAGAGWTLVDVYDSYFYLFEDQRNGGAGVAPGVVQATAKNPNNSNCWSATVAAFKLR